MRIGSVTVLTMTSASLSKMHGSKFIGTQSWRLCTAAPASRVGADAAALCGSCARNQNSERAIARASASCPASFGCRLSVKAYAGSRRAGWLGSRSAKS